LSGKEPAGRQLDFLVQEMHREVNTTGSKSQHPEISNQVVALKAELRNAFASRCRMSSDAVKPPPGILLVLSAPSGAGKTTLAGGCWAIFPRPSSRSASPPASPAAARREASDYSFVDATEFRRRLDGGELVEWAEVFGHFYGSPQEVVDRARASNGLAIFDIDVQGGSKIKLKHPDTLLVFIQPPSIEVLERRRRDRKTDAEDTNPAPSAPRPAPRRKRAWNRTIT